MRQARCSKCRIHYVYPHDRYKQRGAHCPKCHSPLKLTTHLCKNPTSFEPPLYYDFEREPKKVRVRCPKCRQVRWCDTDPETTVCNDCLERERI